MLRGGLRGCLINCGVLCSYSPAITSSGTNENLIVPTKRSGEKKNKQQKGKKEKGGGGHKHVQSEAFWVGSLGI
jgi:hypothetical protein